MYVKAMRGKSNLLLLYRELPAGARQQVLQVKALPERAVEKNV
jgi:hypothetical protein